MIVACARVSSSLTTDWPRREAFPGFRKKPSEGGTFPFRKRRIAHCHTVSTCINRMDQVAAKNLKKGKRRASSSNKLDLVGRRASLPTSRHPRTMDGSTNRNEEWDDSSLARSVTRGSCKRPNMLFALSPELAPKLKHQPTKKTVTFGEPQVTSFRPLGPSEWVDLHYQPSDHARFLKHSVSHAASVRRLMEYASNIESSYNSSIGLTSPSVLSEYLSVPHETIGIEHLLAGQGTARASLRRSHARNLARERARQRGEGRDDPRALADALGNGSRIAGHMARGRAAYVALLDD